MAFNLSESTLKNIIEEVVGKYIELSMGDKFDLSEYLNKIPTEELRLQYVDYSNYDFIYGFDTINPITEDIENRLSSAIEAKKRVMDKFGLKDWQIIIMERKNNVEIIIIYASIFKNTSLIVNEMQNSGFFNSTKRKQWIKGMLWRALKFEPQNQTDLTDKAFEFKTLYHITKEENAENILKNGLVPSSKNSTFKYPNRIYVFSGDTSIEEMEYLGRQLYNKDKKINKNNGKYVLFKINTEFIPETTRFYGDPNYSYGYFTHGKIPSKALSIIYKFDYK